MERSVAYSLVRRRDFKDPDGNEKLYYAQAQARGEMGIREIGQRLEQMCTVTYADIILAYYLYLDNDLAIVSTSTKFIRLLVKQLFSLGKGLGSKFLIRNYLFRKC